MRIMLCLPTFLLDLDELGIDHEQLRIRQSHLAAFKTFAEGLVSQDHDVYCALRAYCWKKSQLSSPKQALIRDWEAVQKADRVIACPVINGESSNDVHVQIGWATGLRKPLLLLLHKPRTKHTALVTGLNMHPDFDVDTFYYADPAECYAEVIRRLGEDQ